ncbi:hypothetical protein [Aureimonas sp. AU40]|nr:hypothetical protein [Aureimonas sp. AU40]
MPENPSPKKNRWRQFATIVIEVSKVLAAMDVIYEIVLRHSGLG